MFQVITKPARGAISLLAHNPILIFIIAASLLAVFIVPIPTGIVKNVEMHLGIVPLSGGAVEDLGDPGLDTNAFGDAGGGEAPPGDGEPAPVSALMYAPPFKANFSGTPKIQHGLVFKAATFTIADLVGHEINKLIPPNKFIHAYLIQATICDPPSDCDTHWATFDFDGTPQEFVFIVPTTIGQRVIQVVLIDLGSNEIIDHWDITVYVRIYG